MRKLGASLTSRGEVQRSHPPRACQEARSRFCTPALRGDSRLASAWVLAGGASRPGPGGERGAALHPGPSLALRASCLTALTCNCQPRASPVNDCACEEAQWGPLHTGLVSRVGAVLLDCLERLTLTRGA